MQSRHSLRLIWFTALFLLLPWPWGGLASSFVPAARYLMLAGAGLSVGLTEGAEGPVPWILGLLVLAAVVSTGLCWLLAGGVVRALWRAVPEPRTRLRLSVALVALGLLLALVLHPYQTPYGHAPRASWLELFT